MIDELDETIRELLMAEIPIKNGEIDINFEQPKRENSGKWTKPTANFFLYDVRENNVLRQHQWEMQPVGNSRDKLAHLKRTPFRVDCLYIFTAWAAEPEDEHRLLSRVLLALFRFPTLPAERLVGSLKNQTFPLQARLASFDHLTNPAEIWASLDNEIKAGVSYIVTLAMDPWTEITSPVVRSVILRSGQAESLPLASSLAKGTLSQAIDLGGQVYHRKDGQPFPGIQVAIKGTGFFATSNDQGRYVLGSFPPGDYTLVAWGVEGKPVERKVSLPGAGKDYDFEF